jgi:DNA repair protein RadC
MTEHLGFGSSEPLDEQESSDCLASLLSPGSPWGRSCAREILARMDLAELARASARELVLELGLDGDSAHRISAAFALARKLARRRAALRRSLQSPRAVWRLLRPRFEGLEQETFLALSLDARNRLRRVSTISMGSLTNSIVHPREVFRSAIREAAGAVVVAHNHPSGDPEPSSEDLAVTRRLCEVGELLGIPLLDHLIVGDEGYVSLRERYGDLKSLARSEAVPMSARP